MHNPMYSEEYNKHLLRLVKDMPIEKIGRLISESQQFIAKRLSLENLCPEGEEWLDKQYIRTDQAVVLAKLPQDQQPQWLKKLMDEDLFCNGTTPITDELRGLVQYE